MKLLILRPLQPDQPLRMFTEDGREFDCLVSASVDWVHETTHVTYEPGTLRAVQHGKRVPAEVNIKLRLPDLVFITEPPQSVGRDPEPVKAPTPPFADAAQAFIECVIETDPNPLTAKD